MHGQVSLKWASSNIILFHLSHRSSQYEGCTKSWWYGGTFWAHSLWSWLEWLSEQETTVKTVVYVMAKLLFVVCGCWVSSTYTSYLFTLLCICSHWNELQHPRNTFLFPSFLSQTQHIGCSKSWWCGGTLWTCSLWCWLEHWHWCKFVIRLRKHCKASLSDLLFIAWGSLVPRPRPAFHHLQYREVGRGLGTRLAWGAPGSTHLW